MSDNSSIEWTDATWNSVVGCSVVSPGCTNCYAMRQAHRLGRNPKLHGKYRGLTRGVNGNPVWTGAVRLHEAALLQPLAWKKPRRIFVNSMSDLFHEGVRDEDIDRVFAVMALSPQHTFQVLTKRSFRMREYAAVAQERIVRAATDLAPVGRDLSNAGLMFAPHHEPAMHFKRWPLPNVWLGVSAENQDYAEMRIPDLLATPAAVRFVSCEPLLGSIDLDRLPRDPTAADRAMPGFSAVGKFVASALEGLHGLIMADDHREHWDDPDTVPRRPRLDWVIAGGESGRNARPMHPDWARALRNQCVAAGVPFFFKQWGKWTPHIDRERDDPDWHQSYVVADCQPDSYQILNLAGGRGFHGERVHLMRRATKSKAPAQLDGRTWREFPS